ncbi:MAG: lysoplasmalogenase [Runella sp.]
MSLALSRGTRQEPRTIEGYRNINTMTMNKLRLAFYSTIVLVEIACVYGQFWIGVYLLKPLIVLSLLYWTSPFRKQHLWLWVGLWFGCGGDVLLMIRERDLFVAGLGSFLVMQLCYIVAFWQTLSAEAKRNLKHKGWKYALPFAMYGLVFLTISHDPINKQSPSLWPPVVGYAVCLCSMGIAAAFRFNTTEARSYQWVLWGAVLFILSDSLIALNKFWQPFEASTLLIMTTYAAAQWLIVWGMFSAKPN